MTCVKQVFLSERRPRWDAQERHRWAQRFYESGLTQREFAARHRIGLSTLGRWIKQSAAAGTAPAFAEIKLPEVSQRWAAELVHTDGRIVRLAHDVPPALLEQLLGPC